VSRFLASFASVLFGLLLWPAHLLARAGVRFVHAVPGANEAKLTVEQEGRTTLVGRAGYAQFTKVRKLKSGAIRWKLTSGGDTLATGTGDVGRGPITAIAMPQGSRLAVKFFKDAAPPPRGEARVRVIHAAPELGEPDVRVDGKRVAAEVGYGDATPYLKLEPGRHDLQAVRAGTSDELIGRKGVRVPGGTTTSAIVIGTSGEPARILTVTDRREEGAATRTRPKQKRSGGAAKQSGGGAGGGTYTVARGDSLWSIARDQLGDGASDARIAREVQRLWAANGGRIGTGDPNLIFPGQKIRLS
jgi:hypothetical protein